MIPLVDPDLTKALAEIGGRAELLLVHLEPGSPLRDEAAAIMDAAAEAAALATGGPPERPPTVLLAEDEDTVRRMLVTVLESAGGEGAKKPSTRHRDCPRVWAARAASRAAHSLLAC